ncbi:MULTISPECIES: GH92 family glycosyl hydrolase [unclassified Leeuwenhoekiella]|uniref:GH92 family glycosyl hydrolase n=1 Tax=unclassified Leeuwenhoekiella TaxID=2615029 RepID=UPI000C61F9E7|nr:MULTISPECIES: GH92 family glycosyl hydrolase [unclassified Leeuwenhoekiella]MAW95435.1 alpha-mannosidase [Leeuwenhoekiella sp.]MBA80822.1 alpha-mannosidase [Leeuwenhoekiella sp.]|tara:strand:+ start:43717 stop:46068 length:2352 start_codon:yes stop_codon:yes gene_type:complete
MYKLLFVCLALFISCQNADNTVSLVQSQESYSEYVDPNIGTAHSRWFFYTPAALPFGMAKLGPSTNGSLGNEQGWEATGYDSRDNTIEGFANLHEFQIGGFLFTGMTGKLKTIPGDVENPDTGYRSRFDRNEEHASPGYYKVKLKDYDVTAELTATKRVGFHKYTYPASDSAYVILDIGNELGESGDVKNAEVSYNSEDQTFTGWVSTYPKYVQKYQEGAEVKMFVAGKINKKPVEAGTFIHEKQYKNVLQNSGEGVGLYLRFETEQDEPIELKAGFSYTSIQNAKANLDAEAKNLSFDEALVNAQEKWEDELSKIKVTDSSNTNKTKFYTGLYHALLGRGLASDVNGQFPENDGSVGQIPLDNDGKPTFNFYNTDAIWGGFWNLTQLWTIAWPEYYNDLVQTHLAVYKNSGWLGDGLANSRFVSGVGTNFVSLIIASAYQAGIRDYDVELAFKAAYENETRYKERIEGAGKTDLKGFINDGYIVYQPGWDTSPEGSAFSVSHTLEYCYSAYAVAQFAKALGKEKEYQELMQLADNWKNLYDEKTDFIRPKDGKGEYLSNFDPFEPWIGYQEGNAWQYTFYVPHQPHELVEKMGEEKFVKRLDSIFTVSEKTKFGGEDIDAFAGLNYLYNQGNQPNLHIAYLFNFTNKPWLTQKWVRKISDDFYGTEAVHGYGYGQDEDQGQLGAWFNMAAMGLFDVKGLVEIDPSFQLSTPLFDKIEITTGWDSTVIIDTHNNGPNNYYIQNVELDGNPYHKNSISLQKLKEGVELSYKLGDQPNSGWFQME